MKTQMREVGCPDDMQGRPGKFPPLQLTNSSQTHLFLLPNVSIVLYYRLDRKFEAPFP